MGTRVLLRPHRTELIEKHSRFLGIGYPCQSLDEFRQHKDQLACEFPDAKHITYAYKIVDQSQMHIRFFDAGEPSGTAGKPILMHIEGQNIINIVLFVVRYFGGIKLGAGGLARAYGNTARQFMQEAELGPYIAFCELSLSIPYSEQNQLDYLCRKYQAEIIERSYDNQLRCLIRLPEDEKAAFSREVARIQITS